MKKKQLAKKSLAVVLSVALLAPTSAFAASPSDFSDFPFFSRFSLSCLLHRIGGPYRNIQ